MGKRTELQIKESQDELNNWISKTRHTKMQKRVKALISLKADEFDRLEDLAKHIETNVSSLRRWLNTYRETGIAGLCKMETRNKPSKVITKEIHSWLEEILTDSSAPAKGYKHLQIMIAQKFNKEIHYHALYFYLRKYFKTKLKTPRKSHGSKDQQAVDAFLKTT